MRSSSNSGSTRPATASTACAAASTGCAAIPRRWNGWRARTSAWCAGRHGYVGEGEQLLSGSLPRAPYRPLLSPLLTAALAPLTGGPFAAARLLSNLAAAGLAWLAFAYGRRLAGAAAGGWAMALAAVNPNLWTIGQHVTTDLLFAAPAAPRPPARPPPPPGPGAGPAPAARLAVGLAAF